MASSSSVTEGGRTTFAGEADEMSLADAQSRQTDDSIADTLGVRSDAIAVAQDSMDRLRRPIVIAASIVALGLAITIGIGLLGRTIRSGPIPEA